MSTWAHVSIFSFSFVLLLVTGVCVVFIVRARLNIANTELIVDVEIAVLRIWLINAVDVLLATDSGEVISSFALVASAVSSRAVIHLYVLTVSAVATRLPRCGLAALIGSIITCCACVGFETTCLPGVACLGVYWCTVHAVQLLLSE